MKTRQKGVEKKLNKNTDSFFDHSMANFTQIYCIFFIFFFYFDILKKSSKRKWEKLKFFFISIWNKYLKIGNRKKRKHRKGYYINMYFSFFYSNFFDFYAFLPFFRVGKVFQYRWLIGNKISEMVFQLNMFSSSSFFNFFFVHGRHLCRLSRVFFSVFFNSPFLYLYTHFFIHFSKFYKEFEMFTWPLCVSSFLVNYWLHPHACRQTLNKYRHMFQYWRHKLIYSHKTVIWLFRMCLIPLASTLMCV